MINSSNMVKLDTIDVNDMTYKISRDANLDSLKKSIKAHGVLEPAVLLAKSGQNKIIFGFNRIGIAAELGLESVPAVSFNQIPGDWYVSALCLKNHRNELGPVGKLKAVRILRNLIKMDENRITLLVRSTLSIPADFIDGNDAISRVLNLRSGLSSYIDSRGLPFKILRDVLRLSDEGQRILSDWIAWPGFGVNRFRMLIEMLIDIESRDGGLESVASIDLIDKNAITAENDVFEAVYAVRYPEYIRRKNTADLIVDECRKCGIDVKYPDYFEGDTLTLSVKIKRGETKDCAKKLFLHIDETRIDELLMLL
jgi:hypothetical protein